RMLPNFLVSAPKLCIFGLNESRFPISALWVGTSGSSSRISSHFARPSDRRWRMSKPRKQDGVVYARKDGKILWIRYWGRNGKPCRESSHTADWEEANRKLRERLQARDGNLLEVIRKGEALSFGEWKESSWKNYSKLHKRVCKSDYEYVRYLTYR